MGKTSAFICGLLTGGAAACVTVLLTTPKPGREVRYDLKSKWNEANIKLVDLKTTAQSVTDSVSEFTRKGIPALQTTAREMKNIINTWKDEIEPNVQRISSRVKELSKEQPGVTVSK